MVLGSKTRNAKVIELAAQILHQFTDVKDQYDSIYLIIKDLKKKYSPRGCKLILGVPNSRTTGEIYIRK